MGLRFADGGGQNERRELQFAAWGRRRTARFEEPQYLHAIAKMQFAELRGSPQAAGPTLFIGSKKIGPAEKRSRMNRYVAEGYLVASQTPRR